VKLPIVCPKCKEELEYLVSLTGISKWRWNGSYYEADDKDFVIFNCPYCSYVLDPLIVDWVRKVEPRKDGG